jgi:hypothetical protein
MRASRWLVLLALLLVASPGGAASPETGEERTLLVHVTSLLDADSDRTALVFRMITSGLAKGHHVVLLFDADGVSTLKMGRWFGGHSTPIDRATIAERDRTDIAALLGTAPDGIPDIYGSLLHFLRGRGLAVYVNKRALELRGIGEEAYDHAAEAAPEDRIIELLNGATTRITY